MSDVKILAVIPARSGSKRLPRKNLMELHGKPLISWTIDAALKSSYIDRVIVSTDSQEIANVSIQYGADVPYLRPDYLASDDAKMVDVIFHLLKSALNLAEQYDYIILLQPTSPLRTVNDVDSSIRLLLDSGSKAIISVCETEYSPLWCNTLPLDGSMVNFIDASLRDKRSQDLEVYYRLNGAIFICHINELISEKSFFLSENSMAYVMSRQSSVDIDDYADFELASIYMSRGKNNVDG